MENWIPRQGSRFRAYDLQGREIHTLVDQNPTPFKCTYVRCFRTVPQMIEARDLYNNEREFKANHYRFKKV